MSSCPRATSTDVRRQADATTETLKHRCAGEDVFAQTEAELRREKIFRLLGGLFGQLQRVF
jgi:hypothetical protein